MRVFEKSCWVVSFGITALLFVAALGGSVIMAVLGFRYPGSFANGDKAFGYFAAVGYSAIAICVIALAIAMFPVYRSYLFSGVKPRPVPRR